MSAYGPQLPDGFKTASTSRGDAGSTSAIIGPVLPPGFQLPRQNCGGDDAAETPSQAKAMQDLYGPSLPPGFADTSPKPAIIGPVLPPGFSAAKQCSEQDEHDDDSDGSDDVIGPMPSEAVGADYADDGAARDIDRRATNMKRRLEGKDEAEPRREEWMTHLPDNLGLRIGLGARTFRKNMEDPTADRSAWTDTPADKAKKSEQKKSKKADDEVETSRHQKRHRQEKELEEQLAQYTKEKRSESLLDIHRKKKKEEKKNEVKERREFNRDEDLKISRIDSRASKALINNAAFLNSKFSSGERKFL
ncbi:GPALPP motifs-containing protein 1-like isoform X1 [Amblyomma americanum]